MRRLTMNVADSTMCAWIIAVLKSIQIRTTLANGSSCFRLPAAEHCSKMVQGTWVPKEKPYRCNQNSKTGENGEGINHIVARWMYTSKYLSEPMPPSSVWWKKNTASKLP